MRSRMLFLVLPALVASLALFAGTAHAESGGPPSCDPNTQVCNPDGTPCIPKLQDCTRMEGPPPAIISKLDGYLPVIAGPSKFSRIDPLYSTVASKLSKVSNAQVRCWVEDDWQYVRPYFGDPFGITLFKVMQDPLTGDFTFIPDDKAQFHPNICAQLDLMAYKHQRPRNIKTMVEMANALDTLAHEPMHIGGQKDELTAQCWALQHIEETGVLLGLPKAYAHTLAQYAWKYIQTTAPLAYQSPLCRDGGLLDLHPNSPAWPS